MASSVSSKWFCIISSLVAVSLIRTSKAIILCDESCRNAREPLEICMKTNDTRTPLYLMGFFPCNVRDFRGRGLTVAGQMAVSAVRRNTSILQNHRLELSFNNTMCDRITGVRAFIDQLGGAMRPGGRIHHMIIGPGCSGGAITIAETAPFYHLTQISYTATSVLLSDKRRFPNFLRTIPSDNASISMIGAVLREYQWRQMAIITQRNGNFPNLTASMSKIYNSSLGVTVLNEQFQFDDTNNISVYKDIVQRLDESGARIVLLNVFEESGRQLLCQAFHKGMFYPRYLYITYYWWSEGWWNDVSNATMCTVDQLVTIINGSIAVDYFPEPLESEMDQPTDVGLTPREFWRYIEGNITAVNYPANEAIRQAGFVYDAIWASAFGLDKVNRQLGGEIGNFSYTSAEIGRIIHNSTARIQFRGVTGKVAFNEFGDRVPSGEIYPYRFPTNYDSTMSFSPFAIVSQGNDTLEYINNQNRETVFPEGVPRDVEPLYIHEALFVVVTILSILALAVAVICIIFNIVFRNKRLVKLTSPYLNVVIILGAIFFYGVVILFGIDQNLASRDAVDGLCQARIWICAVGFSILFGPILAKTFRVYYIFRSVKLKKKPLKDWVLLLFVFALVLIDVIFMAIVSTDRWRLTLNVRLLPRGNGQVPQLIGLCTSSASEIWLPVLLGYKGVYLIAGVILAIQTYNVKIKKLRDSKQIVISVFAVSIVSVVLSLIGVFVSDRPNVFYALLAIFILSAITGVLGLFFIPRIVELWKNPSGEIEVGTDGGSTTANKIGGSNGTGYSPEDSVKIDELKNTITALKRDIENVKQKSSQDILGAPSSRDMDFSSRDNLLSPSDERAATSLGGGGGGVQNGKPGNLEMQGVSSPPKEEAGKEKGTEKEQNGEETTV